MHVAADHVATGMQAVGVILYDCLWLSLYTRA